MEIRVTGFTCLDVVGWLDLAAAAEDLLRNDRHGEGDGGAAARVVGARLRLRAVPFACGVRGIGVLIRGNGDNGWRELGQYGGDIFKQQLRVLG